VKTKKFADFCVEKGTPGFKTWGRAWQMVVARFGNQRPCFWGLAKIPEEKSSARSDGTERSAELPESRRATGIGWGPWVRHGLLRHGSANTRRTRKQFANKPIASHQLVQEKLAWMITEIVKGQLLALHVGRIKDDGKVDPSHIPC